tara:strand:+ start:3234 stop:3407 length:174 start_codon:yes stop_codon:yes gene_type:complete
MSLNFKDYFDYLNDDILIEMAQYYPKELSKMCALISLDVQLEKESKEKLSLKDDIIN